MSKYKYFRATFYYNGKQYSATGKTQREADKKAAIKQDKMERGEIGISPNMTTERWAKEWLKAYRKPRTIEKVYSCYEYQLEKYLYPELGPMRLADVRDIHLQNLINNMSNLSFSYVTKFKILIQGMFKQARISRLIIYDPAEGLQLPKLKKGKNRALTEFERTHILKVSNYHVGGLFVRTLLYTGIRPGEARALQWRHIDLKEKYLNIRQAFESGKMDIKAPKTEAGVRDIPIINDLFIDLKTAKRDRSDFDFVFTQQTNTNPHTESSLNKLWKSFKKEVDISMGAQYGKKEAKDGKMRKALLLSVVANDLSLYSLRHTFCTDLEAKGISINIAKTLMGHSNISVTANIYTHTDTIALENARILMNNDAANNKDIAPFA